MALIMKLEASVRLVSCITLICVCVNQIIRNALRFILVDVCSETLKCLRNLDFHRNELFRDQDKCCVTTLLSENGKQQRSC